MKFNGYDFDLVLGYTVTRNFRLKINDLTNGNKQIFDYGINNDTLTIDMTLRTNNLIAYKSIMTEISENDKLTLTPEKWEHIFGSEAGEVITAQELTVLSSSSIKADFNMFEIQLSLGCKALPNRKDIAPASSIIDATVPLSYTPADSSDRPFINAKETGQNTFYLHNDSALVNWNYQYRFDEVAKMKMYLIEDQRTEPFSVPVEFDGLSLLNRSGELIFTGDLTETFDNNALSSVGLSFYSDYNGITYTQNQTMQVQLDFNWSSLNSTEYNIKEGVALWSVGRSTEFTKGGFIYDFSTIQNSVDLTELGGYRTFNEFTVEIKDDGLTQLITDAGASFNDKVLCRVFLKDNAQSRIVYLGALAELSSNGVGRLRLRFDDLGRTKDDMIGSSSTIIGENSVDVKTVGYLSSGATHDFVDNGEVKDFAIVPILSQDGLSGLEANRVPFVNNGALNSPVSLGASDYHNAYNSTAGHAALYYPTFIGSLYTEKSNGTQFFRTINTLHVCTMDYLTNQMGMTLLEYSDYLNDNIDTMLILNGDFEIESYTYLTNYVSQDQHDYKIFANAVGQNVYLVVHFYSDNTIFETEEIKDANTALAPVSAESYILFGGGKICNKIMDNVDPADVNRFSDTSIKGISATVDYDNNDNSVYVITDPFSSAIKLGSNSKTNVTELNMVNDALNSITYVDSITTSEINGSPDVLRYLSDPATVDYTPRVNKDVVYKYDRQLFGNGEAAPTAQTIMDFEAEGILDGSKSILHRFHLNAVLETKNLGTDGIITKEMFENLKFQFSVIPTEKYEIDNAGTSSFRTESCYFSFFNDEYFAALDDVTLEPAATPVPSFKIVIDTVFGQTHTVFVSKYRGLENPGFTQYAENHQHDYANADVRELFNRDADRMGSIFTNDKNQNSTHEYQQQGFRNSFVDACGFEEEVSFSQIDNIRADEILRYRVEADLVIGRWRAWKDDGQNSQEVDRRGHYNVNLDYITFGDQYDQATDAIQMDVTDSKTDEDTLNKVINKLTDKYANFGLTDFEGLSDKWDTYDGYDTGSNQLTPFYQSVMTNGQTAWNNQSFQGLMDDYLQNSWVLLTGTSNGLRRNINLYNLLEDPTTLSETKFISNFDPDSIKFDTIKGTTTDIEFNINDGSLVSYATNDEHVKTVEVNKYLAGISQGGVRFDVANGDYNAIYDKIQNATGISVERTVTQAINFLGVGMRVLTSFKLYMAFASRVYDMLAKNLEIVGVDKNRLSIDIPIHEFNRQEFKIGDMFLLDDPYLGILGGMVYHVEIDPAGARVNLQMLVTYMGEASNSTVIGWKDDNTVIGWKDDNTVAGWRDE